MRALGIFAAFCIVAAAAGGAFYVFHKSASTEPPEAPYVLPALSKNYTSDTYRFSVDMPGDFTARDVSDSGATTVVLENTKNEGVQITISPFDEDLHELTLGRVQQEIPDLKITEPQPVEIGDNYKGLAFKSDNAAFNKASREVWFVFHGNLYQISTYNRLDPLLKAMFATWKFF